MRESTKIKARHAEINPVACPFCARRWRYYAEESYYSHSPRHWRVWFIRATSKGWQHMCIMRAGSKALAKGYGESGELAEADMVQKWDKKTRTAA